MAMLKTNGNAQKPPSDETTNAPSGTDMTQEPSARARARRKQAMPPSWGTVLAFRGQAADGRSDGHSRVSLPRHRLLDELVTAVPQPSSMALLNRSSLTPPPVPQQEDEVHDLGLQAPVYHIVLIHPNDGYRVALAAYLRAQGFSIVEVDDPHAAIEHVLGDRHVAAVLIDADLPGILGIDLLVRLRNLGVKAPIALVATAYNEAHEEAALEYGAADFLSKSRSLSIIAKRLSLLVGSTRDRSLSERSPAETIAVGPLSLKLRCHRALWKGRQVPLTVTEFKIVRLLACRAGEEVSYREIYDVVHGTGFLAGDGPQGYRSNVRSLIRKIRNRFRAIDEGFSEIENYPAFGYRWRAPECGDADVNTTGRDHQTPYLDRRNTAVG